MWPPEEGAGGGVRRGAAKGLQAIHVSGEVLGWGLVSGEEGVAWPSLPHLPHPAVLTHQGAPGTPGAPPHHLHNMCAWIHPPPHVSPLATFLQDLSLPPRHVEVNVHPTKREVGFLHSEQLVEAVRAEVEQRLLAANSSRSFSQAAPAAQMRATVASLAAAPAARQPEGGASQRPATQPYRVGTCAAGWGDLCWCSCLSCG